VASEAVARITGKLRVHNRTRAAAFLNAGLRDREAR
jgi:DNA-binding CsgD family transcriptional regulator